MPPSSAPWRTRACPCSAWPAARARAVLPASLRGVYDVRDVAQRIVDAGELLELAPRWARNLVTALARVEGRPIGLIASQPRHLGGTLDVHAAQKGAWFVSWCERMR